MRTRHSRVKRRRIGPWPADAGTPEGVAARATYVGSPERESHPSAAGPPALRSDATPCEPRLSRDVESNTAALRAGIVRTCTSAVFEGGFPKYVWTWIAEELYEARHVNGPGGTYKGYRLESFEHPLDPEAKLQWD